VIEHHPDRRTTELLVLQLIAATALWATLATPAQAAGADVFSIGLIYIDPHSTSGPLTLTRFGGQPVDQPQAGTGVRVRPATTLLLSYEHYWSDRLATQLALGVPPTHELEGTGTLSSAGVLGKGQQLSPAVVMRWHFFDADAVLRPYLGLGVNYTWFRRSRITNDSFRAAFYGPNATTKVSASPSWNPVYSAGIDYRLDPHWSIGLSLAYAPLKTRITVDADNTAYGVPISVVTDVRMRTLAGGAILSYRF